MENINRDIIYLICQKLDLSSILKLALVNKRLYDKIFLHPDIVLNKLPTNGTLNSLKRCRFLSRQIKTSLHGILYKLNNS